MASPHTADDPLRVSVLVSGSGTNLQTLIDGPHAGDDAVRIVQVVASKPGALALERAERAGIPTLVVAQDAYPDRAARDRALADAVEGARPHLVVLAGWMSILTDAFLSRFPDRVINLHPSLLPAFPGMRAIEEAHAWGCRVTGVTVHFVEEQVDSGPPVLQEAVAIRPGEDVEALRERIREVEHRLVPAAVRLFAQGRVARHPEQRRMVTFTDTGVEGS